MPATVDHSPPLPGLSLVGGKPPIARFDGGRLSPDGGVLALREIARRLGIADRLAACLDDWRPPAAVRDSPADLVPGRLLTIAAGCKDGKDAAASCWQPTIPRQENLPDLRALLRMGRAMAGLCCASCRQVPPRIRRDRDDISDPVHGGQQRRLFNACDEAGDQRLAPDR